MRIASVSGLGAVWGSYAPDVLTGDKPIGGGEAAFLQTAFHLAKRGHEVTCFYPGERATYQGVAFRPLDEATLAVLTEPFNALLSWSNEDIIRIAPPRLVRVYSQQLNNMPPDMAFWGACDVIASPSMTHAKFLAESQPHEASCAYCIIGAGVDPSRYAAALPFAERKNVVSWWSSPDRGLHHLITLWPDVRKQIPDAELRIFYHLDRFIGGARNYLSMPDAPWRARLLGSLTAPLAPGVKIYGAVSRNTLAKHQMETKVWAFPFDPMVPTEGFAVSGLESLAAGCWAIARPDDAILELYGRAMQWIPSPLADDAFRKRFLTAVVSALRSTENPYAADAKDVVRQFTWEHAAIQLERAIRMRQPGHYNMMGVGA